MKYLTAFTQSHTQSDIEYTTQEGFPENLRSSIPTKPAKPPSRRRIFPAISQVSATDETRETPQRGSEAYWNSLRWGPSIGDESPGIAITTPDRMTMMKAVADPYTRDPEAWEEHLAIASEEGPDPSQPLPPLLAFDGSTIPAPQPLDQRSRELAEATLRILDQIEVQAALSPDGRSLIYHDPKGHLSDDDRVHLAENAVELHAFVVLQETTQIGV